MKYVHPLFKQMPDKKKYCYIFKQTNKKKLKLLNTKTISRNL